VQPSSSSPPNVGGQAVIEGVMMRSPRSFVVAVRRPDGKIALREQAWKNFWPSLRFFRWPFFRGVMVLVESLHNGYVALEFSAQQAEPPTGNAQPSSNKTAPPPGDATLPQEGVATSSEDTTSMPKGGGVGMAFSMVLATFLALGLFVALPHLLTWGVGAWTNTPLDTDGFAFHLVDGILRLLIFVGYLLLLSKSKDVQSMFAYHGAEHKAIWAYESQKELRVEEARPFGTLHPRCGTSFLFVVVGVAVFFHVVFLPWVPRLHDNNWVNQLLLILVKLPMVFPIAGVAYELQRLTAKKDCPRALRWLALPGMWLQRITTRPPTDAQLEIALLALQRTLKREEAAEALPEGLFVFDDFQSFQREQ
jgi:uncharacterized protein YqhQ